MIMSSTGNNDESGINSPEDFINPFTDASGLKITDVPGDQLTEAQFRVTMINIANSVVTKLATLDQINTRLATIDGKIDKNTTAIDKIITQVNANKAEIANLKLRIDNINNADNANIQAIISEVNVRERRLKLSLLSFHSISIVIV